MERASVSNGRSYAEPAAAGVAGIPLFHAAWLFAAGIAVTAVHLDRARHSAYFTCCFDRRLRDGLAARAARGMDPDGFAVGSVGRVVRGDGAAPRAGRATALPL